MRSCTCTVTSTHPYTLKPFPTSPPPPSPTHTGDQKRHLDHLAIQSGGFTTEFFDRLSAGGALGGALDSLTGNTASGMTTTTAQDIANVRAAMAQAEDENDAAAAAALERETAAELQEFAADGGAVGGGGDGGDGDGEDDGDDDGDGDGSGGGTQGGDATPSGAATGGVTALPPPNTTMTVTAMTTTTAPAADAAVAASEDADLMADVVRQAGGDAADLQRLDAALRPIERYAVRFLVANGVLPEVDMVAVEAMLQEQLQAEDIDVDAIEMLEQEEEEEVGTPRGCFFFGGGWRDLLLLFFGKGVCVCVCDVDNRTCKNTHMVEVYTMCQCILHTSRCLLYMHFVHTTHPHQYSLFTTPPTNPPLSKTQHRMMMKSWWMLTTTTPHKPLRPTNT